MKKIGCIILSSVMLAGVAVAAPQSNVVPLPTPGDGIVHQDSQVDVPLNPLRANVSYDVTCHVENNSGIAVRMGFMFLGGEAAKISNFKLNGQPLYSGQGDLNQGDNLVETTGLGFYSAPMKETISFLNLDHDAVARVHDCVAVPSVGAN